MASSRDDLDALFTLPLAEFTAARNALAARLKQSGKSDEAERVKGLAKPSISAWAVNQLYWQHREAFERMVSAGKEFRQAQALLLAGKPAEIQGPSEVRRAALLELGRLAAALLRDAGSSASPDLLRRITTTLEAMSAYASVPNAPLPGRLTEDVDPPGFDALAALVPAGGVVKPTTVKSPPVNLAPLKASLKKAEKRKREMEVKLEEASQTVRSLAAAVAEAETAVDAARRALEEAES